MADVSDPAIQQTVEEVRRDDTDTDWVAIGYEGKAKLVVKGSGSGGHEELMEFLDSSKVFFCLLRLRDGDRESQRIKFVGITFVGEGVGGMQRGRVGVHTGSIIPLLGQCNITLSADNTKECSLSIIKKKLKVAGGADYDTGSNASGYKANTQLRKSALAAYQEKEKQGNIQSVVYVTSALPSTTPVDLGGRKMVAPPTEARKNIKDSVNDTTKFRNKSSTISYASRPGGIFSPNKSPKPTVAKKKPSVSSKPATAIKPSSSSNGDDSSEKPTTAAKPSVARKPSVSSKPKPTVSKKPAPAPASKPSGLRPGGRAQTIAAKPTESQKAAVSPADTFVDDAEERARLRKERLEKKRIDAAKKAKEHARAMRAAAMGSPISRRKKIAADGPTAEEDAAAAEEKKKAEAEAAAEAEKKRKAEAEAAAEAEKKRKAEAEAAAEAEKKRKAEEEAAAAAEKEKKKKAEEEAAAAAEEKKKAEEAAAAEKKKKSHKSSLFDDDDDDFDEDAMFGKKETEEEKKQKSVKASLFGDDDDDDDDDLFAPSAPNNATSAADAEDEPEPDEEECQEEEEEDVEEEPNYDDVPLTFSVGELKAFLLKNNLAADDFAFTPENVEALFRG